MSVSVLNSFIEPKTMLAISSEPGGFAAIGNLFQMISLAINDPEGCVRFNPYSSMNPENFSKYFNCAMTVVTKSIEILKKHGILTLEGGNIYITLLRKQKMKKNAALQQEAKAAEERAKVASRVANCRANKKRAALTGGTVSQSADKKIPEATTEKNAATVAEKTPASVKENQAEAAAVPSGQNKFTKAIQEKPPECREEVTGKVTKNYRNTVPEPASSNDGKPFAENAERRAASGVAGTENKPCNAKCNAPCNGLENGENHNYNYNNYNNYNLLINDNDNYDNYPNYPNYDTHNSADGAENNGGCLPFPPGDQYDNSQLIPPDKLPIQARRVLEAWNNLNLKHYKGLYSPIAERLCEVLYQYGEEAFLKVIENVKSSPFLMGRNNTSNRWRATFTWLLKVKNFLNVLNGKYNRYSGGGSAYDSPGGNRNEITPNIPGCENRADMTPEERRQAYYEYMHPHNELLDEMARKFGVTY